MKVSVPSAAAVFLLLLAGTTHAYELTTHASITLVAFQRSILAEVLGDLGIENGKNPFGTAYYDLARADARSRAVYTFEARQMPSGANPLSIEGWLMRGAIREDDLGKFLGQPVGEDPHDDPYGDVFRVQHHFYDPLFNRALSQIPDSIRTPAWALGVEHPFSRPNAADANRRNHFTVIDAREAMYRALTGRDSRGNVLAASMDERDRYWATTFRALGDVVHLVQDMAQPQHTRNDLHIDVPVIGDQSMYEYYIDARARGATRYKIDGVVLARAEPLAYDGYEIPQFTRYGDYFSTRDIASGRGLADYSNRGFFSAGTNLGSNPYNQPSNNALAYTQELATNLLKNSSLIVRFLKGDVQDYQTGSSAPDNIRLTTESAFDDFTPVPQYSLNRFNYDDMAKLLIPRAVAYSAGLINYFFRGKIDLVPDPANPARYLVRNLGTEPMKGKFRLFYDDAAGTRYPVRDSSGNEIVWDTEVLLAGAATPGVLAAGANMAVDVFAPPTSPAPKAAGEFMLVFAGDMGEEKADSTSGNVGAVVGKKIAAPYNGTLYLAGRTATGLFVFFKVDKSGVSVLKQGDFNPLSPVTSSFGSPRERAYHFKQVAFSQGVGGASVFRTVGLSIPQQTSGDISFVPNPVSGAFQQQSGIVWLADSRDAAVGTFEFHLSVLDFSGRQAELSYTRRFTAQGQPKQSFGVLRLPDLPSNAGYSYNDFSKGVLFINGDGTEIYPRGGASFRRYGVRISLSAIPSAALFELPQPTSTFTSQPFADTTTVTGECSVDYIDNLGHQLTYRASRTRRDFLRVDEARTTENGVNIEGFLTGQLLKWTVRTKSRALDHTVTEMCEASAIDYSTGTQRIKLNVFRSEQTQRIDSAQTESFLSVGSVLSATNRVSVQSFPAYYSCGPLSASPIFGASYVNMTYSHTGFAPCPTQSADVYVSGADDPDLPKKGIYRALTDRIRDAVYTDTIMTGTGARISAYKFRDEILIPGPGFVADASPIGEVFLATSDLSFIVHEPHPGHMPVLTRQLIPEGVVELRAVVWM